LTTVAAREIVNILVNYSAVLDGTFSALADPTRRAILARLARQPEVPVTELARPFAISLPAVSRHLRVLEDAGLVARRRQGRVHHCRLVPGPMKTAGDWITTYRQFWEEKLDALERYLAQVNEEEPPWPSPNRKSQRRRSVSRAGSPPRARRSSGRGPARKG
jgi:DNA-binding transcriptional ArsR family regulator